MSKQGNIFTMICINVSSEEMQTFGKVESVCTQTLWDIKT